MEYSEFNNSLLKNELTLLNKILLRLVQINVIRRAEWKFIDRTYTSMSIKAGIYELMTTKDSTTSAVVFGTIRQLDEKSLKNAEEISFLKCTQAELRRVTAEINTARETESEGQVKNDQNSLTAILNRLDELNLITAAEKRIMGGKFTTMSVKAGIYDLLSKKDFTLGKAIFEVIKKFYFSNNAEEVGERKNPLQDDFMTQYLFSFLKVEDIKHCRLVCNGWGTIGMTVLNTRAGILLCSDPPNRLLANYYSCFPISDKRLSAFEISSVGGVNHCWSIQELTEFFRNQMKYIQNLSFNSLNLFSDDIDVGSVVQNFDISPWLVKSPSVDDNHLTKLTIDCSGGKTVLEISLKVIPHVKELALKHCTVDIENEMKISPFKLEFIDVKFRKDGIFKSAVKINSIMNFSNIKKLWLACPALNSTKLILDLKGKVNIELLRMNCVEVLNWGRSKWSVRLLKLQNLDFKENTGLTSKSFDFRGGTIDLASLHQSIQSLRICEEHTTVVCTQPIQLNQLQLLDFEPALLFSGPEHSYFANCPQLTQLYIGGDVHVSDEIKSSLIPRTVKILKLYCMCLNCDDNNSLNLDALILEYANYNLVRKLFLEKNLFKNLILRMDWDSNSQPNFFDFRLEFQQFCIYGEKQLYVGNFRWNEDHTFDNSVLYEHVEEKSSCYVFKNQKETKGRGITDEEFYGLINFYEFS